MYINESINIKQKLDLVKTSINFFKNIKNAEDFLNKSKITNMLKKTIYKACPEFKSIFSIKVTNYKGAEEVLNKYADILDDKYNFKIDKKELIGIFYSAYGIIIKLLTAFNLYILFIKLPFGLIILLKLAIIMTILIMHNAKIHNKTIKEQFQNFKQSFTDYIKNNIPSKAETKLAIIPFILYVISVDFLFKSVTWTAIFASSATLASKILIGVFILITIYLICDLLDEWILKIGKKTSV